MTVKNLAKVYSAELEGINAKLIEVEIDLNVGLHSFSIVGLADRALNEARERVNSALKNSGVKPPNRENRRITINLAPADVKKAGTHYDLAIALGYLLATKQMKPFDTGKYLFVGELALDGRLRPINGALNITEMARALAFEHVFLPKQNFGEAVALSGVKVVALETLDDAIAILEERESIKPMENSSLDATAVQAAGESQRIFPDFADIVGQENAKRALMIAAAGGHNIALTGPPGVGKSMLAQTLAGILPDLAAAEAIEITKIWSAAGLSPGRLMKTRPFRAPHQTASTIALVGGGQEPKPGEISLAHRGVLFLDELPEFQRSTLEALRGPMESGSIHIARAKQTFIFPAKFILVAAMNPCPCGFYGDADQDCKCSAYEIVKYQKKISGPLFDRIDIQLNVGRVKIEELRKGDLKENVAPEIKRRIEAARNVQAERFKKLSLLTNAEMGSRETRTFIKLDPRAEKFLMTLDKSRISARGYYRILKVARTIADLEEKEGVAAEHLAEAFSYRLRE